MSQQNPCEIHRGHSMCREYVSWVFEEICCWTRQEIPLRSENRKKIDQRKIIQWFCFIRDRTKIEHRRVQRCLTVTVFDILRKRLQMLPPMEQDDVLTTVLEYLCSFRDKSSALLASTCSILYLLQVSVIFVIPSYPLSVFAIQIWWYTIFVQTINLLPPFPPFGTLIFVRLRHLDRLTLDTYKVYALYFTEIESDYALPQIYTWMLWKLACPFWKSKRVGTSIPNKATLKKVEFCVKFAPNSTQIQHVIFVTYW